jgi:hypothetical protein
MAPGTTLTPEFTEVHDESMTIWRRGFGARHNPSTGTYARGAFAYGPYSARGAAQAYNPRTGTYAQTRRGSGVYGSWGSTQVKRGDDWASTKRFTNRQGETTRITRGDQGGIINRRGEGFVGKQGDNAGCDLLPKSYDLIPYRHSRRIVFPGYGSPHAHPSIPQ